jgi:hypothetical protein
VAEKLTTATVHKLPTAKARNAKSSGGKAKPSRMKAPAHAPKATPTEPKAADHRQHKIDVLIALTAKHSATDNRIAVHKSASDELSLERKEVRTAILNAGFPLEIFDERYKKLQLKTARTNLEEQEKIRDLISEAFGLPLGSQPSLLDKLPEAARAAEHWSNVGFREGVMGNGADPVKAGVPPENTQDYLKGHGDSSAVNARGLKTLATPAPKAPAATPAAEAPFWATWSADPSKWPQGDRKRFRDWYASLGPEDDVEIEHKGAESYFDQLESEADQGPEFA